MDRSRLKLLIAAVGAGGALALWNAIISFRNDRRKQEQLLDEYRKLFNVDLQQLNSLRADISKQMELGLNAKPDGLLMLPSFVDVLPTGNEVGNVYAIDLGGTNLRVLHVKLGAERGSVLEQHMQEWPIPPSCFDTDNGQLLKFVVSCTKEVIDKRGGGANPDKPPIIGFCFSFAFEQTALNNGKLLLWTKNFRGRGLIGQDVVAALANEFKAAGMTVQIPAILNDTVATLCALQYSEPHVLAGIILGTGTNCAYLEKVENLKSKLPASYKAKGSLMVVNTEWGDVRSAHMPTCEEDVWVDCSSANPGKGLFEKAISGLYMGEVARRIFLRLAEQAGLFTEGDIVKLSKHGVFSSAALSAVDGDDTSDLSVTAKQLAATFGIINASIRQLEVVKEVCWLVSVRSAKLCAAAIAAIVDHAPVKSSEEYVIAVDGSVFTKYAGYRELVQANLKEICGEELASKIKLQLAPDASVLGAALLAAAIASGSE